MRILFAVHDFLPEQVAGVEVYTDRLSRALAGDHEVGLLHARLAPALPNRSLHRRRDGGRQIYELVNHHREHRFEQSYRDPSLLAPLREVLDEFDPDLLHVQHLINLSVDLVAEAKGRGLPVAMTLHDQWLACANGGQRLHPDLGRCDVLDASRCGECTAHLHGLGLVARGLLQRRAAAAARASEPGAAGDSGPAEPAERPVRRALKQSAKSGLSRLSRLGAGAQSRRIEQRWRAMRELGQQIDLFIAPSAHLRAALVDFGLPEERVVQSDYGFPTDGYARRTDLPAHARRFGYLGSLVHHKGLHVLAEAFESLPADTTLEICGSPDDAPEYAAQLRALCSHPGLTFAGQLPPERVPAFLARIDCLVVPSIWHENSPLVIHEAFLCGVPVVASQLGGHSELLGDGGGLLYPADDPAALARALQRLHREPGLLRELASSIPPVKTMAAHAEELIAHYRQLAAQRT